jgi:protein-disulfide isomerase
MKLAHTIALAAAAVLATGAAPAPRPANWNATVAITPQDGHLLGNPNAPVKLVEYISYTCPHCAHFAAESEAPLQMTFIASGKGSVEIRPFIRSSIDVAASLLVRCGPIAKFRGNHTAVLRAQDKWFHAPSPLELQRWQSADFPTAMRNIATDLKLFELMQARGYTRAELDRCVTNKAAAEKMAAQTRYATQNGVQGTPSFFVNGRLQDTHSWDGLRPVLAELTR